MSAQEPESWHLEPAAAEFAAFACKSRPGWDRQQLDDAFFACHQAGWPWERALTEAWRLLWRQDADPSELTAAARRDRPRVATGPEVNARGRQMVLAAIDEARARRVTGEQAVLGARGPEPPQGPGSHHGQRETERSKNQP